MDALHGSDEFHTTPATHFSSSLSSFGLSRGSPHDDSSTGAALVQYPLYGSRRTPHTSYGISHGALTPSSKLVPLEARRTSLLGQPILPDVRASSQSLIREDAHTDFEIRDRGAGDDTDDEMSVSSPPRSTSATPCDIVPSPAADSLSMFARRSHGEVPHVLRNGTTSPLAVARLLRRERQSSPPFLQRRLFQTTGVKPSGEGIHSDANLSAIHLPEQMTEDCDDIAAGADGDRPESTWDAFSPGIVRRPVSRKPNLLPKSKSHLRVLSELHAEASSADLADVVSEAALHRLTVSGSRIPAPIQSSAVMSPSQQKATKARVSNRFPESIADEDIGDRMASDESSSEDVDAAEAGSDWGSTSHAGCGSDDEDEKRSSLWRTFRNGNVMPTAIPLAATRSPGSDRSRAEPDTTSLQHRSAKRKLGDDRFEPYATVFNKRRAISPAAMSPVATLASPLLSQTHAHISTPPPAPFTSLPMAIAPPALHSLSRSRAGSPAASSLSSSAGRAAMTFAALARDREIGDEAGDGLRNMSLG
ncbi:hypothetical protein OIV83_002142 [Microbotryomycetes sp. JL201]|nr:hypothetical protein OIV83_002142 [Microbotryomycetes sp. JL201]